MNIKKMTAKEITEMTMEQFNKLTAKEAADALKKVRKAVNQRERRFEKATGFSNKQPSQKTILLPQKGLTRNETLAEVKKGIKYLTSKRTTITGFRNIQKRVRSDLGLPASATNAEVTDIYRMFHKLQEEFPTILTEAAGGITYAQNKKRIGRMIRNGLSEEEIRNELEQIYMQNVQNDESIAESVANEFSNISL